MTANKIDTTKYNAMVANASPNVKISSTVFKNFIGDVKSVVDHNADEVDAAMKKTADSDLNMNGFSVTNINNINMTGNLAFLGSQFRGIDFKNGDSETHADLVNFPEVSTANVVVRLFRRTDTSGVKIFQIDRGDGSSSAAFRIQNGAITRINEIVVTITAYEGNPNGNVAAPPGSICLNTSGGAGSSIYVKESGTGNTGWVAK